MKAGKRRADKPSAGSSASASVRATISFPTERYGILEEIAKQKKVSIAWVVREAIEEYVMAKWPLFEQKGRAV